ncbi:MAG TPA: zinc-dependent peptidase [Deltaproteobacteria bacterium]|nr:zinc-dependent peptidase [Deltaproteobacteria bacterium]
MLFHWLRERRRRRLLAEPFPEAWNEIIRRNVAHDAWLDEGERRLLRDLLRVFIHEKNWEGCGGLELSDEIRVTIAAQACLLILNLPHDAYRRVRTILVYPSTVVAPPRPLRAFEVPTAPVQGPRPILGEAWLRGPVILVWDAVRRTGRHPESGHNVVYHEFAHQLDLLDGLADGTPPLHDREEVRRWAEVCSREYLALRDRVARGKPSLLDAYGATNEAEFFAVATEEFFDRPVPLRTRHPQLYEVLQGFYRQDPAARVEARSSSSPTA